MTARSSDAFRLGLGLLIFAASYGMPVLHTAQTYLTDGNPVPGWACAWMTLTMPLEFETVWSLKPVLAKVAFLPNVLMPVWLALTWIRKGALIRMRISYALVFPLLACIALFAMHEAWPMIGFYAWFAGMFVMCAPDLAMAVRRVRTEVADSLGTQ